MEASSSPDPPTPGSTVEAPPVCRGPAPDCESEALVQPERPGRILRIHAEHALIEAAFAQLGGTSRDVSAQYTQLARNYFDRESFTKALANK